MKFINLTGQKFGRLIVLKSYSEKGITYSECVCDCGKTLVVRNCNLRTGNTTSCGCYNKEIIKKASITHGKTYTRLYRIWSGIKTRCYNSSFRQYKDYGGRGIRMYDEWTDNFQKFYEWAINNGYSDNLSIDRIDVNGNYDPDNCRWVDAKQQANNTRRNHLITYNENTYTMKEISELYNIPYKLLFSRLKRGWDIERAITEEKHNNGIRKI